ncbi:hypothetical protein QBC40DRAFT_168966 [Triangularia verruculosa]|uniref:Uncharacterized protein n=1 Tax=Triangularia verruculosa TaxID=2587418 RepID=A0AAN6XLK8_9PEZI|nr:hypothetical protein QBC40DRAFT_168966 [Triangularia verruculosa]
MTSLVSEFIITPVLRQARRFSSSFATEERPASRHSRVRSVEESASAPENAIMEDDQDVVMVERNAGEASSSPVPAIAPAPVPEAIPPPPTSLPTPTAAATTTIESPSPSQAADILRNTPEVTVAPRALSVRQPSSPAPSAPPRTVSAVDDGPRQVNTMRRDPLPEDDGMGELRKKIRGVQEMDISQNLKAQLVHQLLTEKYTQAQQKNGLLKSTMRPESPMGRATPPDQNASPESFGALHALKAWNPLSNESAPLELPLTAEDLRPTYAPAVMMDQDGEVESPASDDPNEKQHLGCRHYRRNVKLQCATCERWYTCRMCHDAVEDHVLPRQQTKHMLCMLCGCAQKASDTCVRCGESAANYYCGICKLWNDDPNKPIYHCSDCGLCRVGQGLGKDFYHCKKCMACISINSEHKCIERSIDCDCPICGDYLFNSMKTVVFMQCGHSIHKRCFEMHMETSYRCPICSKSCVNMETQFRNFDLAILSQPMPPEYVDARAIISCNDCSAKSQTAYHWLGLKCSLCNSYNTIQRQLLNMPGGVQPQSEMLRELNEQIDRLQQSTSRLEARLAAQGIVVPGRDAVDSVDQAPTPGGNPTSSGGSQPPTMQEHSYLALSLPSRAATPLPAYEVIERARREQEARARRLGGLPDSLGNGIEAPPPAAATAITTSYTPLNANELVAGLLPAPSLQPQPQHQHQHQHRQLTADELTDFMQGRDDEADDDEDEDTFLDLFWGRDRDLDRITNAGTAVTSLGSPGGVVDEEEDSSSCDDLSSEEEEEDDDDEEDDENEIVLLGHR